MSHHDHWRKSLDTNGMVVLPFPRRFKRISWGSASELWSFLPKGTLGRRHVFSSSVSLGCKDVRYVLPPARSDPVHHFYPKYLETISSKTVANTCNPFMFSSFDMWKIVDGAAIQPAIFGWSLMQSHPDFFRYEYDTWSKPWTTSSNKASLPLIDEHIRRNHGKKYRMGPPR